MFHHSEPRSCPSLCILISSLPVRRIRTIIISTPFLVASSILLYKRLFLGEEQKHLPRPNNSSYPSSSTTTSAGPTLSKDKLMSQPISNEWNGVPDDVRRRIQAAEDQGNSNGTRL
ncbi:uncharacterized protein JCM15063_001153 [Sporobolomyces koalae]|uniref:uncharacterized protein n=1 Tax=Sporobolomyces koalae TaxID=500713 RepID=UPI00316D7C69